MRPNTNRYRVAADFSEAERNALDVLCTFDYRPPAEQLRWLVMQEAQRRGLAAATNEPTKHNCAVSPFQSGDGAIVAAQ